ncbi:hypothetical protein BGZ51_003972 [Haplosporangium sp. Z 767]|nr:hypothetical protein BGZ51_003972 [Haplosporangium sp. Z 767]
MQMRPPPSPGNNTMNLGRPPHPMQKPPTQHPAQDQQQRQQQLQPPMQPGGTPGGRSPVLSPFQKQEPGSEGQPQIAPGQGFKPTPPTGQHGQPSPVRPGTAPTGTIPPQRPPQQPHQQQLQMQPRPHAPTSGQQPGQFSPGRPLPGPMHTGGQPRPAGVGPNQSQPMPDIRPMPHPGQQQQQQQHQQQQAHQPLANGTNMRPSSSHPNLAGGVPGGPGGPGIQPGSRFTPPSPSLGNTRSPQIRPLQHSPQNHEGARPIVPQQQQQQQQQQYQQQQQHYQQQQPGLRPSSSQPHLVYQPGMRPSPAQHSPVQAHQALNTRPSGPMIQQQPRLRPSPSQAAPPGQTPEAAGHSVQLDMPAFSGGQMNGGQSPYTAHQSVPQQQHQRPPGARPILDPHRQQTSPMQPVPAQAQRHPQASPTQNPTQRPLQRPPSAQTQPLRHQPASNTMDGSPQHGQGEVGQSSSLANGGSPKSSNDDNRQAQRPSPQQQHPGPPIRRPTNPQLVTGDGPHQSHSSPGPATQSSAPRPVNVQGSPGQRSLGVAEIKLPGPTMSMPARPNMQQPPQQQRQMQQPPPQKPLQPEASPFTEPETPPSDSVSDIVDDDGIENRGVKSVPPNAPTSTQPTADRPPPQAVTAGGPPQGPPRGPPRNEGNIPRKVSTSTGSGPARIIPPSNNPSSPPASAFPPMNPLRPRMRPPPGNKIHTPYRPPERPSQAPVMYSQSGQPTLAQPFSQQDDKSLAEQPSIATSMVPQGAEAASSSIRPREGGLQKRAVANDTSSSKADGSAIKPNSPPSPKLHDQKGPAILSVTGQRRAPSATRTLKTWMIRGGIVYLGYTAVFNCAPDTTGVKGLYCKTTNGLGGLVKPLVAPHYNAYLGPHVDQYIKPVTRQGHRIYMKVGDPVVQGAMSVAGTVYKSTAKKHVDSVKDQVISILPYPFKPKTVVSKDSDRVVGGGKSIEHENHPELGKISRQPIHVEDPKDTIDEVQPDVTNDEHAAKVVKEDKDTDKSDEHMGALKEGNLDARNEDVEHGEPIFESTEPDIHESTKEHEEPEDNEEAVETEASETMENSSNEQKHVEEAEETNMSDDVTTEEAHVEDTVVGDSIVDKPVALKDSLKNTPEDTKESTNDEQVTPQKGDEVKTEEPIHADPARKSQDSESTLTVTEEPQESIVSDPVPAVAESTPEFVDIPTGVTTPEEEEQAQPEMTTDAAEPKKAPVVAEEEPREHIPAATDAHTSFDQEDGASQGHDQQQDDGIHATKQQQKEKDADNVKKDDEDVQEQAVKETEQVVSEEHKESDATPEQQAAPVPEAEHRQEATNAHDEL